MLFTPSMRRVVTLVGNAVFPSGRVRMTKPNRPRKAISCRIPHRIDYTAKTATVAVPGPLPDATATARSMQP